jgi:hypothetical protein
LCVSFSTGYQREVNNKTFSPPTKKKKWIKSQDPDSIFSLAFISFPLLVSSQEKKILGLLHTYMWLFLTYWGGIKYK